MSPSLFQFYRWGKSIHHFPWTHNEWCFRQDVHCSGPVTKMYSIEDSTFTFVISCCVIIIAFQKGVTIMVIFEVQSHNNLCILSHLILFLLISCTYWVAKLTRKFVYHLKKRRKSSCDFHLIIINIYFISYKGIWLVELCKP